MGAGYCIRAKPSAVGLIRIRGFCPVPVLGLTNLVWYPFRFGLGLEMKDSVSERGLTFTTAHAVRFGLG